MRLIASVPLSGQWTIYDDISYHLLYGSLEANRFRVDDETSLKLFYTINQKQLGL